MYEIFDWSFIILCFLVNDTTNSWYRFATFVYIVVVNIFLSFFAYVYVFLCVSEVWVCCHVCQSQRTTFNGNPQHLPCYFRQEFH